MFFVNSKSVLLVAFVKYASSKLYSHCIQYNKFYYFLETRICFVKKDLIFLCLCIHFVKKISKNDSRKSFIKNLLAAYYLLCYLVDIFSFLWPDFSLEWLPLVWSKMYEKWVKIYSLFSLLLWKIHFYTTAFGWLWINNKCGFRLANRFAQREFLKFFMTKHT